MDYNRSGEKTEMIPIAKPLISKEEKSAVIKILDSGWLVGGEVLKEFERSFAKFTGTEYAIGTPSGTSALFLALLALDIGSGDEVITTPFSFIASSDSILYTGAKPVFVDIDEDTFNIAVDKIEQKINPKTKAILVVHLFGLPADMRAISKIAKKHKLKVIEDSCQAHGAEILGKKTGSFGTVGCFSFYATKNMTTGEGGMVTTNSKRIADRLRMLRSHGMRIRYHHEILGYNFVPTNIASAIGIEQLKKLPSFNRRRISNAKFYNANLKYMEGLILPHTPKGFKHVFHQYTLRIKKNFVLSRAKFIEYLRSKEIDSLVFYPIPIHKQKVYKKLGYTGVFPVAEQLAKEVVSIPVHPGLKSRDLMKVVSALKSLYENKNK